jgi:hypothetical protein
MSKNRLRKRGVSSSLGGIIKCFEENDLGERLAQSPEVIFDVDIKRRKHLVSLDPDLSAKITRIAKAKKTSSESLINSWVREKISESGRV